MTQPFHDEDAIPPSTETLQSLMILSLSVQQLTAEARDLRLSIHQRDTVQNTTYIVLLSIVVVLLSFLTIYIVFF